MKPYNEDIMFNEVQKMEYVNYLNAYTEEISNYFKRIKLKETQYNKDIADMNENELMDTLICMEISREESRRHMLSFLRKYINWAMLFDKTSNNSAINRITAESIGSKNNIENQMLGSPNHLEYILEYGIPKNDDGYYLMPNRAIRDQLVFWLIFSGIGINELCTLKKTDIDVDNRMVITSKGKKYVLTHKIVSLWKECCGSIYIERRNGKATGKKIIEKHSAESNTEYYAGDIVKSDLVDNKYLFRPIRGTKTDENETFKIGSFATIIYKVVKYCNEATGSRLRLSPNKLKISGIFYTIYEHEKNGNEIALETFAEKFGIKECKTKLELQTKTRTWKKDYEDWKLVFSYMNDLI